MKVRQFCNRDVVTVAPDATLREAALLMRTRHVGALVVVSEHKNGVTQPVGMLTDRDIVVAVIAIPGARPEGIRVVDVMSTRLATVREDDGVFEAVEAMSERGVRRMPVVGADGALRGIVTADDVLRIVSGEMASLAAALRRGAERESLEHRLDLLAAKAQEIA